MSSILRHLLASLLVLVCVVPLVGAAPEPGAKVFILRMKNGFDLHLSNRLTQSGLLLVVTDPHEAEYVLTENIGPGFDEVLKELFSVPEEEDARPSEASVAERDDQNTDLPILNRFAGARPSTFGKAGGVVFLVKRADASVIWSTFLERRDTRDQMLDKQAGNVVKRIGKWLEKERQPVGLD